MFGRQNMNRLIFFPTRNQQKILKISHKNYNGLCERPTQSVISHLHILWTMVKLAYH
jgi:hypothetical protein